MTLPPKEYSGFAAVFLRGFPIFCLVMFPGSKRKVRVQNNGSAFLLRRQGIRNCKLPKTSRRKSISLPEQAKCTGDDHPGESIPGALAWPGYPREAYCRSAQLPEEGSGFDCGTNRPSAMKRSKFCTFISTPFAYS